MMKKRILITIISLLLGFSFISGCITSNNPSNDDTVVEEFEEDNGNEEPDDDNPFDVELEENLEDEKEPEPIDNEPEDVEEVIEPEEVELSVDHPQDVRTNWGHWYEILGEPEGSNITWLVDSDIVGYGNRILYEFPRSDYFLLEVIVKWADYEKIYSETIPVRNCDKIGGFNAKDRELLMSSDNPMGYGLNIEPGISVPTLWLNISISNGNGVLNYWMDLQRENDLEPYEIVVYESLDLNFENYSKSYYFDEPFFIERSNNEPYIFWFKEELGDDKGSFASIETWHELRY